MFPSVLTKVWLMFPLLECSLFSRFRTMKAIIPFFETIHVSWLTCNWKNLWPVSRENFLLQNPVPIQMARNLIDPYLHVTYLPSTEWLKEEREEGRQEERERRRRGKKKAETILLISTIIFLYMLAHWYPGENHSVTLQGPMA